MRPLPRLWGAHAATGGGDGGSGIRVFVATQLGAGAHLASDEVERREGLRDTARGLGVSSWVRLVPPDAGECSS
jgi:hypothetical protein